MSLDSIQTRRVILTGGRRTYSGPLGNHMVQNGVITLRGSGRDIIAWEEHIAANWQGYPAGDPRIEEAEQAIAKALAEAAAAEAKAKGLEPPTPKETSNGQGHVQTDRQEPNGQAGALSDVLPAGVGADQANAVGQLAAGAEAGQAAASATGGNGSAPRLTEAELNKAAAEANPKLARAIAQLDHGNAEHWTQDGKPRLDVLEGFYGASGLKRSDVDAITGGSKRCPPRK